MQAVAFADDDVRVAMRNRLGAGEGELGDFDSPETLVNSRQGRPRSQQRRDPNIGCATRGSDCGTLRPLTVTQAAGGPGAAASASASGSFDCVQPPPSATIRLTASVWICACVDSSNSSAASCCASAVTTVVKACVPAWYSLSAICVACREMRTSSA